MPRFVLAPNRGASSPAGSSTSTSTISHVSGSAPSATAGRRCGAAPLAAALVLLHRLMGPGTGAAGLALCRRHRRLGLVPRVDALGIDLGGINQPIVEVPVATLTGWNLRTAEFTEDDYCDLCGMTIPLFRAAAERLAAGDPRPSLEELYQSHGGYVSRIAAAALALKVQRLMLQEDVDRVIAEAAQSGVLK